VDFVNLGNTPLRKGSALIQLSLAQSDHVRVDVFDVSGRLVKTVADRQFPAGPSPLYWDGTDNDGKQLPRGVYFTHIKFMGRGFEDRKKITLLR
jgi:flagellar hook assembly protein FlgD